MELWRLLHANLTVIAVVTLALWLLSVRRRNVNSIDVFWGSGFVLVAWTTLIASGNFALRPVLLTGLVTVWGLRLSGYLLYRNWGKAEDYRYATMRAKHCSRFPLVSLLTVFGLQGALMLFISLPLQVGISRAAGWHLSASVGIVLWLTGLFFESVGDYQLARFKADPATRGRVMSRGLWRYTRHPNYFGDFLVWWGFFLVAAESNSWWWTIVGPLTMSFLLIRVSGVRLLESSLRTRVDGYEEYVRSTSSFLPLPPRRL